MVSVLVTGLLSVAAQTSARADEPQYTFQNFQTERNLDAVAGYDQVRSWPAETAPDSTRQKFTINPGSQPGDQIKSVAVNKCLQAVDRNKPIALETCNTALRSQYWATSMSTEGDRIESVKFPGYCIEDVEAKKDVLLRPCNGKPVQSWMALPA
ncbi:RICIN domain-containing protein [Kitasatospora sp. NPDC004531]